MGSWGAGQVLRDGRRDGGGGCLRGGCRVAGWKEAEVVVVVVMAWE